MTEPKTAPPAPDGAAGAAMATSDAETAATPAASDATGGTADGPAAEVAPADVPSAEGPGRRARAILLGVGVLWLLAFLWAARASAAAFADRDSALLFTAENLFGPVTAALTLGGSAALAALGGLGGRERFASTAVRFGGAAAAGLVAGVACALVAWALVPDGRIAPIVTAALAAAGVVGGALAGFRPARVYAAGLVGTYLAFGVRVLLGMFTGRLSRLFGASNTIASVASAQGKVALFTSLVAGVVAGYGAYRYLRRSARPTRWPGYLAAGTVAGALGLLAEVVSRIAGSALLDIVPGTSAAEHVVLSLESSAQIDGGMIVLFAGAFTAVIAIGRTLSPKSARPAR